MSDLVSSQPLFINRGGDTYQFLPLAELAGAGVLGQVLVRVLDEVRNNLVQQTESMKPVSLSIGLGGKFGQ